MEILFNAVGGLVVEVGKFVCKCIYPHIENTVRFSSNIENLKKEFENLIVFRDGIKVKVDEAEGEGYKPKPNVFKWIEDVGELENEWETMQESIAAAKKLVYKCCPKCSLRSEVSTQARNIQDQLCRLKEVGERFGSNLLVENYQMKKVEFIPGPSIQGQSTATRNLNKIQRMLEDDKVCIIGVWGSGGIGKTTLVKNLNNELLKTTVSSSSKLSFGVVVWVTVPKPPINIRMVQEQIASRLNLNIDNERNVERIAVKINDRLKQENSFLLILDDVWESIDLDHVGVPQRDDPARRKVILTSRFLNVCSQMKIDTEMKVFQLDEDESWKLFVEHVGDVANLEDIQPLAMEITRECDGLPLAISVIGASMRGKKRVELWKDALNSLRMSEPHNKVVEDKVYKVIKYSYDSLESQDVNKRRGHIQSCFLYCSLYPENIPTDDFIHCWWAERFLGEHNTYEEAYNRGITMIESLKDAFLLETHLSYSLKMHDVVRDVAIWIANSFGDEHNSVIQAGNGLTEISNIKVSACVKRISFIKNKIERLPDHFTECPETTTLLLQFNNCLQKIPRDFFLAFPALRVLNLSSTLIRTLPSSINSLCQLHALILQNCPRLKELPPIGNLFNLKVLNCDFTNLLFLQQGMDKLTNPRLFNEISSLHKMTCLSIQLDSSSVLNRDHSWMTRLERFMIRVGKTSINFPFIMSRRMICISNCEFFSNGELSGMLQFASELFLENCLGLRKLIVYNCFNGLKSLYITKCNCDFRPAEEGRGKFDPLPNLEYLSLDHVVNLKNVSNFSQFLGLRFSKLRQLNIYDCSSLTCLFNIGGAFSVPKHLEEITITYCVQLVELLFLQCSSSQATLVDSEIPRVRKLELINLPELGRLGEPESVWEHLEELEVIKCKIIKKLPLCIQTSNNIKVITGESEWWSQLEWDDDNSKSNLQHCFTESRW